MHMREVLLVILKEPYSKVTKKKQRTISVSEMG
jgi:hypothetical protein